MKKEEEINESFSTFGRETPFTVPNNYFEQLPTHIQNICLSHQKPSNVYSLLEVIKSQLALASGFLAFVVIAIAGYYYLQPHEQNLVLSNDDYIEIVQKNITEFDEVLIMNEMKDPKKNQLPKHDLTEEMIRYLVQENIDYVTLMEQY